MRLTYGENATRYTEEELTSQFMKILESQPSQVNPVGILTTQRRDMWAESWDILQKDEQNRANLDLIEKSLITICLDSVPLSPSFIGWPNDTKVTIAKCKEKRNASLKLKKGFRAFDEENLKQETKRTPDKLLIPRSQTFTVFDVRECPQAKRYKSNDSEVQGEKECFFKDSQVSVPKLPVPSLEHTMTRYLETLQPILDSNSYDHTRQLIATFMAPEGVGVTLQNLLIQRRVEYENWAYNWWLDDMYLNCKLPLPININPGMVFPPKAFIELSSIAQLAARLVLLTLEHTYNWWLDDMYLNCKLPLPININPGMVFPPKAFIELSSIAQLAARLVLLTLEHKDILNSNRLPVEKTGGKDPQPMCMAQYHRVLRSYRRPGLVKDSLVDIDTEEGRQRPHVLVAWKNQVTAVDVDLRIKERDEQNRANLDLIEKSLITICLDSVPLSPSFNTPYRGGGIGHRANDRDETSMAHQMIHGGGTRANSANRWFDKTIQLIICHDGVNGLCYEHSSAEGVAVVNLMEKLIERSALMSSVNQISTSLQDATPEPLLWNINASLHKHIRDAARTFDSSVEDLDFLVFRFTGYGKDFIKSVRCSPDAFIQLAMQVAYHR
ncbi:choline O-acetyltransferase-like [Diaphorina citri]|uniref:Choline O-acetyltransferase n=1 Tax=Diaphorina citri TaxID=121845 RepID=A0A3Q0J8Y0_DIACI|nr:choline O-acetyltransferase-like [Diaphorina citri]